MSIKHYWHCSCANKYYNNKNTMFLGRFSASTIIFQGNIYLKTKNDVNDIQIVTNFSFL